VTEPVLYHEEDAVAYLTLNRPEKLNALNPTVFELLGHFVDHFAMQSAAKVLILHGNGSSFAAGADIEHYVDLTAERYAEFMRTGNAIQQKFVDCPKPIVAAVHGYALGGGLELALVCDIIIAAPDAQLGLPEVMLGLLPGGGGTQRLTRNIGSVRTFEILTTARRFSGDEAVSWGLALGVRDSPNALDAAEKLAKRIAEQAQYPVRMAKTLLRASKDTSLDVGLAIEQAVGAAVYASADAREGIAAFTEKRRPRFGNGGPEQLRYEPSE
jgi:enoyl-CoA hydratase/carnithine racemase